MSSSTKRILFFILAAIAAVWAVNIVLGLVIGIVKFILPIAIIGALAYGGYMLFGRKALGSGNRRTLP